MHLPYFFVASIWVTLFAPSLVLADSPDSLVDGGAGGFGTFASGVIALINGYLIPLFIAIAVLAFIWGVTKYFVINSDNEESRNDGKMLMLYAIIGFVVIVALWGIVTFVASAIGVTPGAAIGGYPIGPGPSGS